MVEAAGSLGGVDVLVHNAGGWSRGGTQYPEAVPAAWRTALGVDRSAPGAEQVAALSAVERVAALSLVPPEAVAAQVVRLVGDDALAGRVVTMLRGDEAPILLP